MKQQNRIRLIVVPLILIAACCLVLWPFNYRTDKDYPRIKTKVDIASLSIALNAYLSDYGQFPTGKADYVEQILSGVNLDGKNPKNTKYLSFKQSNEHPNEMTDPWNTPYQIEFSQQTSFIIRSAGKNKTFGDKDDIIFNSVSNDFVKP